MLTAVTELITREHNGMSNFKINAFKNSDYFGRFTSLAFFPVQAKSADTGTWQWTISLSKKHFDICLSVHRSISVEKKTN